MNNEFDNMNQAEEYLKKVIADSCNNQVLKEFTKVEKTNINKEVYNKYHIEKNGTKTEPFEYIRRKDNGGLSDCNNTIMEKNIFKDNIEIIFKNITKGNGNLKGKQIADLIEYGDNYNAEYQYNFKKNKDNTSYQYLNPRPFMEKTKENIVKSKKIEKILKNSLKNNGFDVK